VHELSVCQGMLSQMRAIAAEHGAHTITAVTVQVGPLSGVEPDLLVQAFSIASAGGIADGAQLQVDTLPIRVHCESCGAESEASANRLLCGSCGDWHTRLISGDELLLASVELEKPRPS